MVVVTLARETVARPDDGIPTYDAREITGKEGLAHIALGNQIYTLRITRSGKLILTK